MRKHFESGLAFIIVALLSILSGVLQVVNGNLGAGLVFLLAGGLWIIIAMVVRNRLRCAAKEDEKDPGAG